MCMRMYILAFTGLLGNYNLTYLVVPEAGLFRWKTFVKRD